MKNEKTRKIIQKEEKMGERRFSTKNRFVSFLLAIAMVLTLLPIGAVQAKAEGSRQIIMHFKNSTNWEAVYTKIAEGKSWTAVDGYGYAAPAVTIYGTSWNETGRWDIDGCPACGNGSRQGWNTNQTAAEDNLVTRLTHFFFHKHAYYGDK